jgi:hypothetical protein
LPIGSSTTPSMDDVSSSLLFFCVPNISILLTPLYFCFSFACCCRTFQFLY